MVSPASFAFGLYTLPFLIVLHISEMLSFEKGGIELIQKNYGKAAVPILSACLLPCLCNGLEEWTEGKQYVCLLQKYNVMVWWVQTRMANIIYEVFQRGKETAAARPWRRLVAQR